MSKQSSRPLLLERRVVSLSGKESESFACLKEQDSGREYVGIIPTILLPLFCVNIYYVCMVLSKEQ